MLLFLSILNTVAIIYLIVFKDSKYYFEFKKEKSNGLVLLGYMLGFWKITSYGATQIYYLYLPIRNAKKIRLLEEVQRLINNSQQNKLQSLSAMFSWLKTLEEVKQFEKDYMVVDRKIVENLVANFKSK